MSMYPAQDKLPADLRAKQRACVHHHNLSVLGLFLLLIPLAYLDVEVFGARTLPSLVVLIVGLVAICTAMLAWVPRTDARFSRRIGFVCPRCGQPLYFASSKYGPDSPLITRGECPHCGLSFLPATTYVPNHALQRTATGGRLYRAFYAWLCR